MFKQRLITTLILIPIVLLAIFYAPVIVFATIVGMLMFGAGWEWLKLIPVTQNFNKVLLMLSLGIALWLCPLLFSYWLVAGLVLWGLIVLAILSFPQSEKIWGYGPIVALACLLLLPLFAITLTATYLHLSGQALVVYLLALVWAADVGAYLAGKSWGKHKLIPKVSPGKTFEGTFGGILLALLVAWIGSYYFKPTQPGLWYLFSVVTVLISIVGDLFISILKRRCRLKDTGDLIPGHGGLLDRLDSLIAAAPVFYYGLKFISSGI